MRSHIQLFSTPWTVACQAPLSMGFPRQKYWRGLPFPSSGDLLTQGSNPNVLHWQANSLPASNQGNPILYIVMCTHQSQFPNLSLPRNPLVTIPCFLNEGKTSNPLSCLLHSHSSHARLFATPWTVACQAPLSMRFPRQEHWSGLLFPSPGDFLDPGIESVSPALQADSLPTLKPRGYS